MFCSYSQNSDFQNKIGTMIDFNTVPQLNIAKNILLESLIKKNLECEGNRYYDIKKNGIGWHGDSERKKVIGLRLGETSQLISLVYKFKTWEIYLRLILIV